MSDEKRVVVVIDRKERVLRLKERTADSENRLVTTKSYPIAIGAQGYRTEPGYYVVETKVKDPDWHMPYSDWVAKELQGTIIPGGDPANPIRERWIEINAKHGEGIHGTLASESIGTRASHGCVRMLPKDVIDLYPRVPIGSIVIVD